MYKQTLMTVFTPVINWKNSDNFLYKLPNSVLLCIKIHALLLNYQLNCKLSYNETEIVSMLSSIMHQFVNRDRHMMMYCILTRDFNRKCLNNVYFYFKCKSIFSCYPLTQGIYDGILGMHGKCHIP